MAASQSRRENHHLDTEASKRTNFNVGYDKVCSVEMCYWLMIFPPTALFMSAGADGRERRQIYSPLKENGGWKEIKSAVELQCDACTCNNAQASLTRLPGWEFFLSRRTACWAQPWTAHPGNNLPFLVAKTGEQKSGRLVFHNEMTHSFVVFVGTWNKISYCLNGLVNGIRLLLIC